MDFTSSGSLELGRDLQKNGPFFFAFWEFRAWREPPEKLSFIVIIITTFTTIITTIGKIKKNEGHAKEKVEDKSQNFRNFSKGKPSLF